MNSLYTQEIREYLFTRAWPHGLKWVVEERFTELTQYLQFVLYRDNFERFDGDDKLQIANTVGEVMHNIRKQGVPIYLEVKPNAPRSD